MRLLKLVFCLSVAFGSVVGVAHADEHRGAIKMKLTHLYAVNNAGAPVPSQDALCESRYGYLKNSFVEANYYINTTTGRGSANLHYLTVNQNATYMGVSKVYGFITSAQTSPTQPVGLILFTLTHDFKTVNGYVTLDFNVTTRCTLASPNY